MHYGLNGTAQENPLASASICPAAVPGEPGRHRLRSRGAGVGRVARGGRETKPGDLAALEATGTTPAPGGGEPR